MDKPAGGWTVETALEHVQAIIAANDRRYEQRFDAQKESVSIAMAASDRAVSKAEAAAEKRFEGVNEFRGQLADQQRTLMPRAEAEIRLQMLAEKIEVLNQSRIGQVSRGLGAKEGWGWAVGVIGLIVAVVALLSRFTG